MGTDLVDEEAWAYGTAFGVGLAGVGIGVVQTNWYLLVVSVVLLVVGWDLYRVTSRLRSGDATESEPA